jgi:hypothetical protein
MASARPADSPAKPGPAPVLKLSPRCPTCSRTNVVTFLPFTPVDPDRPVPTLVCLHCCPEPAPPFDARAAADAVLTRALRKTLQAERQRDEAAAAETAAGAPAG